MATISDIANYGNNVGNQAASEVNQKLQEARAATLAGQAIAETQSLVDELGNRVTDVLESYGGGYDYFSSIPISDTQGEATNYKVRLVSVLGLATAFKPDDIGSVIFDVTPSFTETGNVSYNPVQSIHMPGSIQTYKSTDSRTFSITATLVSRNTSDVVKNMRYLQTLRSWRYPFFGQSTSGQSSNSNAINRIRSGSNVDVKLLGAPPEVLFLYAYSSSHNDNRQFENKLMRVNINRIPVLLTSLNIEYPQDVDYIPSSLMPNKNMEPFPVKMTVSLSLVEAHSPVEFERFDLMSYKTGTLSNF